MLGEMRLCNLLYPSIYDDFRKWTLANESMDNHEEILILVNTMENHFATIQ